MTLEYSALSIPDKFYFFTIEGAARTVHKKRFQNNLLFLVSNGLTVL